MTKKTMKRLIQAAGIITDPAIGPSIAVFMNVYDKVFKRYERPDYSLYPGLYFYDLVKDEFKRREISFQSKDVMLAGYYYERKNPLGLVVTAHGIHSGADDYIPIQKYFYDKGFNVFSFDYRGTYSSEGDSTVGACESLFDLDQALKFIESCPIFKGLPIFLFGHSWGGYACLGNLSIHKNIKAVASVSAMSDGHTIIIEKAKEYTGKLHYMIRPYIAVYQRYLFKEYADYDSIKGINSCQIPIFIAHGVDDMVINYYDQGVSGRKDKIKNPNVIFYDGIGLHGGHMDILLSDDAVIYRKEIDSKINMLKHEKKDFSLDDLREFYKTIDHKRYSNPNLDLLDSILNMFLKTL